MDSRLGGQAVRTWGTTNLKPSGIAKLSFGHAPFDTVAQLTCGYNVGGWVGAPPLSRNFPYGFSSKRIFSRTEP
jgi:hypothetical protein